MKQITFEEMAILAINSKQDVYDKANSVGKPVRIYLHWSAGHYGQAFSDYHVNIDHDGTLYSDIDSFANVLSHTWRENTGSIGIGLMCCAFATTQNFGEEPPTEIQIETMSKVVAILSKVFEIPIDYEHVQTHAESANEHEYGPLYNWERWDGWYWNINDTPGSGGDIVRGKANWYLENWVKEGND